MQTVTGTLLVGPQVAGHGMLAVYLSFQSPC